MATYRRHATLVGVLFATAIVTLFAGQALYNPFLEAQDVLQVAYPNRTSVVLGILIEYVGFLGLAVIPILLFPLLKRDNEVLARGYISMRLLEVVLLTVAQICKLVLVSLSQGYLAMDGADASFHQGMVAAIKGALYWNDSDGIIYLIVFVIGALMLYAALYRSRLVPRWLSTWGLVAAASMLVASLIATFGFAPISVALVLMMLIPLQELTMSVWFIVKGFDESAVSSAT